jgi:hypothetical protein
LARVRRALDAIVAKVGLELPHGLAGGWEIRRDYAACSESSGAALSLPALLSQVLLAFTLDSTGNRSRRCNCALAHCALSNETGEE